MTGRRLFLLRWYECAWQSALTRFSHRKRRWWLANPRQNWLHHRKSTVRAQCIQVAGFPNGRSRCAHRGFRLLAVVKS